MDPRSLQRVYSFLKPIIFGFNIDAEYIHEKALEKIKTAQEYTPPRYNSLSINLFGHNFVSPLLLAAGFDKNGLLVDNIQSFGFAGEVVGSITFYPSNGENKPRLFRLSKQRALLNRMGLNNEGAERISKRLEGKKNYAISIAKTNDPNILGRIAINDYVRSYKLLKHLGIYTEINISCPNTEDGETFEDPASLELLLDALLSDGKGRPLLIKISPCLDQETLEGIVEVSEDKVDGYVATNTIMYNHPKYGKVGLSGLPIKEDSLNSIKRLRRLTKKPIIGVGGIFTGWDAFDALRAGADLLEALTGFIYRGPTFAIKLTRELDKVLQFKDISHIAEIKNYNYKI